MEFIQFVPDKGFFDARLGLDNVFLGEFPQIRLKDVVKRDEIDRLRRILLIEYFHFRQDFFGHILHSSRVVPDILKVLKESLCHLPSIHTGVGVVARRRSQAQSITGKIYRAMYRNILCRVSVLYICKAHLSRVRLPI